jgi:hypothetical protein
MPLDDTAIYSTPGLRSIARLRCERPGLVKRRHLLWDGGFVYSKVLSFLQKANYEAKYPV